MVLSHTQDDSTIVTLLPNRSASWAEMRLYLLLICGTTLAVGLFWAFVGFWAILPFSGLEAALVAWLLYRVCQASYQRQVITCSPQQVLVQFGSHFPRRSWRLERERTRLAVTEARHHLEGPRLDIFDSSHSIELGAFLNKDDKEEALRVLRSAGLQVRGWRHEASTTL